MTQPPDLPPKFSPEKPIHKTFSFFLSTPSVSILIFTPSFGPPVDLFHHGELFYLSHSLPTYLLTSQAHRIVSQVVVTGARVFGRAFAEAYKQASASSKYASKNNGKGGSAFTSSGLTLDEACKILNVKPPQGAETNLEQAMERFKKLFDQNDPKKGGSFYLQRKILRARERIEMEVRQAQRHSAQEKELQEGWKPKVYKDR